MGFIENKGAFDFKEVNMDSIEGGVPKEVQKVWASKLYIVRHYCYENSERLSVDYVVSELNENVNMIKWDHMQKIKNLLGFADRYAVELFPPQDEEMHGIEQRHLWLVGKPDFGLADYEKESD